MQAIFLRQNWCTNYLIFTLSAWVMSLHSLQCQWTLQMGAGNMGLSQKSLHRESEKDLHLNMELSKIICRWLERENIYIFGTRYWTKSYSMFISMCFYSNTQLLYIWPKWHWQSREFGANSTCYLHDSSLGLRATGTCHFQATKDVSSQHKSQVQKYSLLNYNGIDLGHQELQWLEQVHPGSLWQSCGHDTDLPNSSLSMRYPSIFSFVQCLHSQSHSTLIQEGMSLEFYFHSA